MGYSENARVPKGGGGGKEGGDKWHLESLHKAQGLIYTAPHRQVVDCLLPQNALGRDDEQTPADTIASSKQATQQPLVRSIQTAAQH